MAAGDGVRLTIDEIEPDESGTPIATLVADDGAVATIPLDLLPAGAGLNQVIVARFVLDEGTTEERRRRVAELQHRLFHRRHDE
jgi:hypothetical protein